MHYYGSCTIQDHLLQPKHGAPVVQMHLINSQKVTFPYPTYSCTERMSVNGEKGSFQVKENWINNSHTKFHACISCGLFVRASESWEKAFSPGKNITQNGYFYLHVISWRMQSSIQLFFLHIVEELFLYQTWKLQLTASVFYIFNLIWK